MTTKITIDNGNDVFHIEVERDEAIGLVQSMIIGVDDHPSLPEDRWNELMTWLENTRAELEAATSQP